MGDFKKNATPPTDDNSPAPLGLGNPYSVTPDVPAVDVDQDDDDKETTERAQPYWHPAWEKVQERFEQEIEARNPAGGANVHRELPAEEFKIRMIVDADVVAVLESIMEDVKSAVEQVESRPKRGQSNAGGK